jgi:hypothetical protein
MGKKFAVFIVFALWVITLSAQDVKSIDLKNIKILYPLKNYHIALVKDDRSDTTNIGSIRTGMLSKKKTLLNLQNGVRNSFAHFINNNVVQDTSTSALELHISRLDVTEKSSSGLKTENELTISFAFFDGNQKLTESTGGGTTQSTGDASKLIEELIRGSLENTLHQFDDWWLKNKAAYTIQKTKPSIKVEVSMEENAQDSDIVSYSLKRPLTLDDFQGKPDDLMKAAAISTTILYIKYSSARDISNLIMVDVFVIANFDKTRSWCRQNSRNIETLEHEQRHFDITAIKACELTNAIKEFQFSIDNYPRELEKLQRQKQKELGQMQDQYDSETRHGLVPSIQQKWDKIIKDQLQKLTCFHS